MTDWLQQIALQRAGSQYGSHQTAVSPGDFFAVLDHLGHIAFSGDDAASFLHNQLTNDVEHLATNQARLAGYCSPKGRMLASLYFWRAENAIVMQLPRELLQSVQKRLQMYVLRAKVKITDSSDDTVAFGFAGNGATTVLQRWFEVLPVACFDKVDNAAGTLIRSSDANNQPRWVWVTSTTFASGVLSQIADQLKFVDAAHWRLSEIHAGLPHITLATQEKFVPQMINFEAIGGVNFKKGCYPGQEIVARSQYLGSVKRRMLPASIATVSVAAGMEVFSDADSTQPCGIIVNAELSTDGRMDCLVEVKLAAHESGAIHLGVDGPLLHFSPLPYLLPDAA